MDFGPCSDYSRSTCGTEEGVRVTSFHLPEFSRTMVRPRGSVQCPAEGPRGRDRSSIRTDGSLSRERPFLVFYPEGLQDFPKSEFRRTVRPLSISPVNNPQFSSHIHVLSQKFSHSPRFICVPFVLRTIRVKKSTLPLIF